MIDNYDSFTFNLVQYFGELGEDVRVFRNDEIDVDGIAALRARRARALARAVHAGRGGRLRRRRSGRFAGKLPILGVCLGHQAIGAALGGKIVRARALMHGKTERASRTDGRGVYARPAEALHGDPLPLAGDRARDAAGGARGHRRPPSDGEIMGVRHRELAATRRRSRACSSIPNRS